MRIWYRWKAMDFLFATMLFISLTLMFCGKYPDSPDRPNSAFWVFRGPVKFEFIQVEGFHVLARSEDSSGKGAPKLEQIE